MVLSAAHRASVAGLTRRKARTVFSVATLAIAVASISFLAIPTLIDRTMQDEVREGRLADATISMRPVQLTDDRVASLEALPNVAGVEPRSSVDVRVLIGDRRAPARIIGVRDFQDQAVDVVRVESGAFPSAGEFLADVQDANTGVYHGQEGDVLTVLRPGGDQTELRVSGRGRTLPGGELVQDEKVIVLYATAETVAGLSGETGFGELALDLDDPSPDAARETLEAVRRELDEVPGFSGFSNLPAVREPGDWPGRSDTESFGQLISVISVLALLSAVVLISNTMSTMVAEQSREIAVTRAVGARRRQVAAVYLRTTLVLGGLAALVGVVLGTLLANLLARYFGETFWAVDVGFGVDPVIAGVSVAVALLAPPVAALPAIRRALRVDLRESLEASGAALGGEGALDRVVRGARLLPRAAQIGLGNVVRRKRRSLATASMVALAVANLLAVMAMAEAAGQATRSSWGDHLEDVQLSTAGAALFDERAGEVIRTAEGVREAEPVLKNEVELAGREAFVWAMELDPLFRYRLAEGRWFSAEEEAARERVAVIERNIAQIVGVGVGDRVALTTAAGEVELTIVGIAENQQEDGTALYVPLTTARQLLGRGSDASAFLVAMTSSDEAFIDRTTALLEDRLAALGYEVRSEIRYIAERDELSANRSLTTSIAVLGFVIVAMSMVGLANTVTTNVLERTREIGVLRSIGARSRDVRRIFTTEGLSVALVGWLLGIPLGYGLTRLLVRLVWEVVEVRLPVVFPPWNVAIALAGTVLLALLVLHLPVRRAVRLKPGDALRFT